MKRTITIFTAAVMIAAFLLPLSATAKTKSNTADYSHVRVQLCSLGTDLKSIKAELKGNYILKETDSKISDTEVNIELSTGAVTLSVSGSEKYTGKEINLLRVKTAPEYGYVKLPNERTYLGDFSFKAVTADGKTYIQVINKVPTIYYLYGVLKGEMGNDAPQDALKAQSLSAKSYVLARMKSSDEYDVGDTSRTQVYNGYDSSWNNIITAVNSTANEVIFLGNEIMYALYASSNGGETDIPSHAWGSGCTHLNPGYEVAIDQYDFDSTGIRETLTVELGKASDNEKLNSLLLAYARKENAGVTDVIAIDKCEMNTPKFEGVQRNMTNAHFEIRAEAGNSYCEVLALDIPAEELLNYGVFSKTILKTYWGEKTGTNVYNIYHARNGHGVGLSQRAAKYRAMLGQTYKEILDFYFPGTHIGTIASISDSLSDGSSGGNTGSAPFNAKQKVSLGAGIGKITKPDEASVYTSAGVTLLLGKQVECYAYTKVSGAYMYAGASSGSTIINRFPYGEMLLVLGTEGEWVHAQTTGGMTGYVPAGVLEFVSKGPTNVSYKLGKITADDVNFRAEPSTNSTSLGKLAKNTQLYVWNTISNGNVWYYVQCGLKYGYVSAQYVSVSGTYTANEIAEGCVIASGITKSNVNLRPEPSTSNNPIEQLAGGTYLLIYSLNNGWYRVITNGKTGYVSESYVTINTALPIAPNNLPASPAADQPIGIGTVNATNVRFRSTPDTSVSDNIIALLQRGDKLTIFKHNNGWYYASFEGKNGYVADQYVDVTPMTPPDVEEGELHLSKGETTGNINFREGAGTGYAVYKQLPKGTKFELIGECNEWYFVKVDNICGFIVKQYAKITEQGNVDIIKVGKEWKSYTTKATADVNLRLGPSVLYSVTDVIEQGENVTVLAIVGEWCLVIYNGTLGYCAHDYLAR